MLAIAISLLFGLAAFAAVAVIQASLVAEVRRARIILSELAEIDSAERGSKPARLSLPAPAQADWVLPARCAAA